jgi:hypothetical protein
LQSNIVSRYDVLDKNLKGGLRMKHMWLILVAALLVISFGMTSKAIAGSVNVDLDNDRNTAVIDNDADPVTIWVTIASEKHLAGEYTVVVTPKGELSQSVCVSLTACGTPHQWYWAQVSFDSLLNTDPVGQVNVQVLEGCGLDGKVVGGQTVTVTQ